MSRLNHPGPKVTIYNPGWKIGTKASTQPGQHVVCVLVHVALMQWNWTEFGYNYYWSHSFDRSFGLIGSCEWINVGCSLLKEKSRWMLQSSSSKFLFGTRSPSASSANCKPALVGTTWTIYVLLFINLLFLWLFHFWPFFHAAWARLRGCIFL